MERTQLRVFSAVLALQFLNVQVQTAFGSEAVVAQSPEVRQVLARAESAIESRISRMGEEAQLRLAYRLHRTTVKLRNRLYKKSSKEIEKRVEALAQWSEGNAAAPAFENGTQSAEEQAWITELAQDQNELGFDDRVASAPLSDTRKTVRALKKQLKKEKLLHDADALLGALGATSDSSGRLKAATRAEFENRIELMEKNQTDLKQLRGPASMSSVLGKILLALLVITLGIALIYAGIVAIALSVWGGNPVGWIVVFILVVAAATIWGVVAIVRASHSDERVAPRIRFA